jgi:hypothetical protein
MSVRSADNVVTRSHSAKVQASGGVLETTRVSTERLERASEGLLRKGAQAINAYFDANVGDPFPVQFGDRQSTRLIQLATIPGLFAFTALQQELKAVAADPARLSVLTERLDAHLRAKGYEPRFQVSDRFIPMLAGSNDGITVCALTVRLRVADGRA